MEIYILGTRENVLLVPNTRIGNTTNTPSSMVKTVAMSVKQARPGDLYPIKGQEKNLLKSTMTTGVNRSLGSNTSIATSANRSLGGNVSTSIHAT